jgi:murein DD-endopeptidase MepM/ murein hydrolase activator NlpD
MHKPGTLGGMMGLAMLFVAACGVVAAYATVSPSLEALQFTDPFVEALALHGEEQAAPSAYFREEQFQRADTTGAFLARLGITDPQVARLRSLRELRPGTFVSAEVDSGGELISLSWLSKRDTLVRVARDGGGFTTSETLAPLEMRLTVKSGVIRSSLFGASDEAGIPDGVAMQLADVFAGDIDFHRDLRKGDRFNVVYEAYSLNGRAVRAGRVVAAEFVNQGRSYKAVRYETSYYTPEGKSLRKAFLRSPLEFSRVSSGFGMRKHPLFKTGMVH